MTRRSTPLFCLMALSIGILIGAGVGSWPFSKNVQADALNHAAADQLYRELGTGTSALVEGGKVLSKIAALTTPSVVHIQSERTIDRRGRRSKIEETGSGILATSNKSSGVFVVTNRHVVADTKLDSISIHLHDGRVVNPTRFWEDRATDVAVMQIDVKGLHPARWGDSDSVDIGHIVLAMGSPFGLSQSVTFGIISAKGRRSLRLGTGANVINQDFLQTDAAINPGNSGGPLIDLQGRVIGINTAIASNSGGNEGIGFSIPSNLVKKVVDQLLQYGKVQRAYLGVKLDPDFDTDAAARLKLDRARGARVVEVYPNTPAARASLKFNDVILKFDGVDVLDENHLINIVSLSPVEKQVQIVVMRAGKRVSMTVVLGNRPTDDQRSEIPSQPDMGTRVENMGLTLHQLDQNIAGQLGFDDTTKGLLVLKVESTGPLGDNVELYDLIEEVARTPVSSVTELEQLLSANASSDSVLLKVRRSIDGEIRSHVVVWERD